MRRGVLLVWCWLAFPVSAAPLDYADARHLLGRTGFAPSEAEILAYVGLSRDAAVERLLAGARQSTRTAPPSWIDEFTPPRQLRSLSEQERKAWQREQFERSIALRAWWYEEMLTSPSPLTERMTLFWHNHFVSSQQKVKLPGLMLRQNLLLRRHALGNFAQLLHAVAQDPAMIVYLDNVSNRKAQPNENFARELMELFTLGEGHYTEQDVREAARAFTGWSLDRDSGQFRFYARLHDSADKTVLGRRGAWNGDDVLNILLEHPATAEWITAKLWRELISPQPEPESVKHFAAVFRDSGYDITALLRVMLQSDAFYAPVHRASLIKSPVELMLGSVRQLGIPVEDTRLLVYWGNQLGQNLFSPPNVKGWPGGEYWVNSTHLLARKQFLSQLLDGAGDQPPALPDVARDSARAARIQQAVARLQDRMRFDVAQWSVQLPNDSGRRNAKLQALLLPTAPLTAVAPTDSVQAHIKALLLDPTYQLK